MSNVLSVRWSLVPLSLPRPWRHCRRCERARPFESSGRFRVNAQKKRLDAWLIYKCAHCAATWNLPLVERQAVEAVEPDRLACLTSNDPAMAVATAGDVRLLRRHCQRIEPGEGVAIQRERLAGEVGAARLEIRLAVALPVNQRLDRLLAEGLELSRSAVARLATAGLLQAPPDTRRRLGRPAQDGQAVWLELAELEAEEAARVVVAAG